MKIQEVDSKYLLCGTTLMISMDVLVIMAQLRDLECSRNRGMREGVEGVVG